MLGHNLVTSEPGSQWSFKEYLLGEKRPCSKAVWHIVALLLKSFIKISEDIHTLDGSTLTALVQLNGQMG